MLELLRSPSKKQNLYHEMVQWYLTSWRESSVEEDIAHWGIPYSDYVREYVDPFSELIPISRGDKVYDSAVGSGWLIRGLLELKQQAVDDWSTVQWYGNDILLDALRISSRSAWRYFRPRGLGQFDLHSGRLLRRGDVRIYRALPRRAHRRRL